MEFLASIGDLNLSFLEILGYVASAAAVIFGGFMTKFWRRINKAKVFVTDIYEAGKAFNDVQTHFVESLSPEDDTPNKFDAEETVELKRRWGVFSKELKDVPVSFKDIFKKELPE